MFAIASRPLSIAFLLVIHATCISARKPGSNTVTSQSLKLDSIESATFALYIIFAFLTVLQVLGALGALSKRRSEDDFPRRVPFILLIFLSIISLLATHILDVFLESRINNVTPTSLNFAVLDSMSGFVHALTHVFRYAALLLLLDYRNGHSKSVNFVIVFRVVSAVLLVIMLASAVARAITGSTQSISLSYSYGQQPLLAEPDRAYAALYHLFLACYLVLTTIICGLCIVLWMTKQLMDSQNDWLQFDASVLSRLVRIICPFITILAVYALIFDIITSVPQFYSVINIQAFILADILIRGLIHFAVNAVILGLGFPRIVGRSKGFRN